VIVEYCRYGNIQNYLIRNRSNFINQVDARGYINPSIGADLLVDAEAQYVFNSFQTSAAHRPNEMELN
jgi:FMS-like tyrosine kinase 1